MTRFKIPRVQTFSAGHFCRFECELARYCVCCDVKMAAGKCQLFFFVLFFRFFNCKHYGSAALQKKVSVNNSWQLCALTDKDLKPVQCNYLEKRKCCVSFGYFYE